jgi:KDO2-lipid IV(A) lauroyltransferase
MHDPSAIEPRRMREPSGAAGDDAAPERAVAGATPPPSRTDRLEYLGFRLVFALFALLPRRIALATGAALGEALYWIDRRDRVIALRNLAMAFPEKDEAERRAILRRSCRNLGRVGAEWCHLPSLTPQSIHRYVEVEDPARWQAALSAAAARGAVIVTAHLGNFELLAYAHGLLGHPITLVHRPMRNRLVDRAITGLRARAGTVSLAKKTAAKAALRALHERRIVAIPADQNQTRRYGVFVDVFGVAASTTPGPARLAALGRAPIIPVFLVREGESARHRIVVLPEIVLQRTGDREADIIANTQRCSDAITDMLRRHPDQWIWFHKRWKTRPIGAPRIY